MSTTLLVRIARCVWIPILVAGCGVNLASPERGRPRPDQSQVDRSAAAELAPFSESFDAATISPRWEFELADASRMQVVASPVRRGNGALKITLHPKDRVAKKNRAEIKLFNREPLGTEGWYAWSFLIPEDYADTPRTDRFQIIGQWHDQPPLGTAWKDYAGHPPLLAVRYGTRDGKSGIAINYGLGDKNTVTVAQTEIQKGHWVDLLFHIKWSMGADGFVEVWKDGVPISRGPRGSPSSNDSIRVTGANMFNSAPPYLKLGLYRKDGFDTVNSLYFDEIRVGRTRAEVEAP